MKDTGDFLKVPPSEQLDEDDYLPEEDNVDEFADLSYVPDGEYVELTTAEGETDDVEDEEQ